MHAGIYIARAVVVRHRIHLMQLYSRTRKHIDKLIGRSAASTAVFQVNRTRIIHCKIVFGGRRARHIGHTPCRGRRLREIVFARNQRIAARAALQVIALLCISRRQRCRLACAARLIQLVHAACRMLQKRHRRIHSRRSGMPRCRIDRKPGVGQHRSLIIHLCKLYRRTDIFVGKRALCRRATSVPDIHRHTVGNNIEVEFIVDRPCLERQVVGGRRRFLHMVFAINQLAVAQVWHTIRRQGINRIAAIRIGVAQNILACACTRFHQIRDLCCRILQKHGKRRVADCDVLRVAALDAVHLIQLDRRSDAHIGKLRHAIRAGRHRLSLDRYSVSVARRLNLWMIASPPVSSGR